MRLFLSLDNPKNAQINDEAEPFGADEADSLVSFFFMFVAFFSDGAILPEVRSLKLQTTGKTTTGRRQPVGYLKSLVELNS